MQFGINQIAKFPTYSTDIAQSYVKTQEEARNLSMNDKEFLRHAHEG